MASNQKHPEISRLVQILCIACFVFVSPPSYATYYGKHHYQHRYGHYGYSYYRPYYNRYYGYHQGYHGHYGAQAYFSGDAAYIVLGVLGAALLTQIFTNNKSYYKKPYPKAYSYTPPVTVITPAPVNYQTPVTKTIYHYGENEGWERLANGNADYALDIFAVQSQQNLNSGEPKVGFAIAAATLGEKERAIRVMRKAVCIDANALNSVDINTIKPTIKKLTENYKSNINDNPVDTDTAFMLAILSYLQQDYETANTLVAENDQSQSAINLRKLLKSNVKNPLN